MNHRSRMMVATLAAGMLVSVVLTAAGAPVLVVLPAMALVMGPAGLTYAWLARAAVDRHVRARGMCLAAGGLGALVAGGYGWHPFACVGVAVVAWLITAAVLDDHERQRGTGASR